MNRRRITVRLVLAIMTFALFRMNASAQVTGGTIQGTATNPAGAVIVNVSITIRNIVTGW
jgi:hypothetical protein